MDQPEAVTSERETMKRAVAEGRSVSEVVDTDDVATVTAQIPVPIKKLEKPVAEASYSRPRNVGDVMELYEYGRAFLTKRNVQRWCESFALGVAADGIYFGEDDAGIGLLGVFWRTHNPVVDIRLSLPEPSKDGSFVYVCWIWNRLGEKGLQALRDHIERTQVGAKFIAHHDQRKKAKESDRLITTPIGSGVDDDVVDRLLKERNGHGR